MSYGTALSASLMTVLSEDSEPPPTQVTYPDTWAEVARRPPPLQIQATNSIRTSRASPLTEDNSILQELQRQMQEIMAVNQKVLADNEQLRFELQSA